MKLYAARPGRDTDDIAKLLVLNEIESGTAAEDLFELFYPGDALPNRSMQLVNRMLQLGLPEKPLAPERPRFDCAPGGRTAFPPRPIVLSRAFSEPRP